MSQRVAKALRKLAKRESAKYHDKVLARKIYKEVKKLHRTGAIRLGFSKGQ